MEKGWGPGLAGATVWKLGRRVQLPGQGPNHQKVVHEEPAQQVSGAHSPE